MNTGANNEWGGAMVKFLTGFIGGYLGGTGQPLNPLLGPTPVDLNLNWNFDPTYAFGGTSGGPVVTTFPQVFYDKYAEIFFKDSNAYGNGYSDALMNAYTQGGPLLSVANTDGSDVGNIGITLFDDSETPTGYVHLPSTTSITAPTWRRRRVPART